MENTEIIIDEEVIKELNKLSIKLVPEDEVEGVKCTDVEDEDLPNLIKIIEEMKKMLEVTRGYGLAAPQIGLKKKFFVLRDEVEEEGYSIYYNSKYFKNGSKTTTREGCLSYQLGKVFNEVKRWKGVTSKYEVEKDGKLIPMRKSFTGLRAIGIQHETDHCGNGEGKLSRTIFMK